MEHGLLWRLSPRVMWALGLWLGTLESTVLISVNEKRASWERGEALHPLGPQVTVPWGSRGPVLGGGHRSPGLDMFPGTGVSCEGPPGAGS